MSHLYKAIPIKKDPIIHMDSHTYRGIEIVPHSTGYKAEWDSHKVFACTWWKVERKIDEILKSKNN